MQTRQPAVYIMCNKPNGTLYVGVTSDLIKRVYQHKNKIIESCFTAKYHCVNLVYYEFYQDMLSAIAREKNIKAGKRNKKLALINKFNPAWADLYSGLL